MLNQSIIDRDLSKIWHPCTQMKDHADHIIPLIPIKRGEGVWLEDFEGKRYLDAISSWWVNLFGHANPRINHAIQEQVEDLEHTMLAGFTHEPVLQLTERLIAMTPVGLTRTFYSDNGSTAVEIALKMSFHYWQNVGKKEKTKFIALERGYHGETFGALAVTDVPLYKEIYQPLLMQTLTAPSPAGCFAEAGESYEAYARRQFAELEKLLQRHAHEVAGIIIEPLVQGAGGMLIHHPVYLQLLREACDKYDVHLIADEVAVGFGRTGTMFACEQAQITPDFMCLSKGITGGYLPLSATLTTEQIYQAFYDDYTKLTTFIHSHSYSGNPLACAAALATFDIFEQDDVIKNNKVLSQAMHDATIHLADHPHVKEVRQQGMILAIEMVKDKQQHESYAWQERRGAKVYRHAVEKGAFIRPLGDVVYFIPPYVITTEEIQWLAKIAEESIDFATQD